MIKHLSLVFSTALLPLAARAQNVGIGTASPNAQAALDITATGKGLLIPRMDSAARAAIAAPVPAGLMVYQTNGRTGFWYYTGSAWAFIPDKLRSGDNLGSHSATQDVALNGNGLKLNSASDDNSKLTYDATSAGPVLTGATGGQLGYRAGGATTAVLQWANVSGNSRVGIGLAAGTAPSRSLDVGGAVRLRSLTTAGVVTTDANGVLSSEANQTLSISGQTLSISGTGGNSVTLPSGGGSPSGVAGGDLTGTYPNPTVATGAISTTELADNAVTNAKVADKAIGVAELSATGTASSSTYLRGDNTWATLPGSNSWSLSGNATDGNGFLGTTNDQDLIFKRNGNEAFRVFGNGRVSLGNNTPGSSSVLLGFNAGVGLTTAQYNVIIGGRAGQSITTNNNSTFVGYGAGQNTTGESNTLLGFYAGNKLTSGTSNVFIGNQAAYNSSLSITGTNNVVIGSSSGVNLTSNSNNILLGGNAQADAGLYDAYAIGNNATVTQNNSLVIGNARNTNDAISVGIGTSAPSSTLQVNGTFAVGVVAGFGGGTSGSPNGFEQGSTNTTIIGGYFGLAPGSSSNYYQLPNPTACPGRIYYLRNNSTSTSAFLLTTGGSIYGASSSSAVSSTTGYEMKPTIASKTVIAISDGTNWTVGYLN